MFNTVLIANRGEIALRIVRTCRELGIRSVIVHSTADRDSAAVRLADQAIQIGPSPAKLSYLNAAAIVEAAVQAEADAIHPGYGFLSEDPDFAEICASHGITFIGPPPAVMARLSDKAEAREVMVAAGLPVLPGSPTALSTLTEAQEVADAIGYPVMLKAAAGGGGKGMQVVRDRRDLPRAYRDCRATAQSAFGDGRVYLERYLETARHVEIQVLCDLYGNAVHLGERDCSVQRRHQKLVEETPAPELPPGLAARMGEAAVRAAIAVGYSGVGTFEFLVDPEGEAYFMEINCRIQVEHPVTEMVTGIDLIREQILVAGGRPLSLRQEDIQPRGAAIECRINAEDPDRDFRPTPGVIEEFVPPGGAFVRVDSHCYPGWRVTPDYDSLLGKVVVWAPDREQAIARMDRALAECRVSGPGVATTAGFLRDILLNPLFASGKHSTSLVDQMNLDAPAAG
ncbi:acetyl-CoA carboxylase biotin carboxylase subunit [Micromonospora yasonensis]|uniref:acetyl-CoA carboxylase biotin carboxylase subunit n=1 Tax=Micromonospora yasonensis TaxID=1128667 RepID=UPI002231ED45|nr:acetyl-CoA carboxylase biotin carboxylase subunit [Micromonospora yasonensis]MCW3843238.1 acetyl-CoA carboxylase biotin carboxylase subunit [Micromonospora yasonensis]